MDGGTKAHKKHLMGFWQRWIYYDDNVMWCMCRLRRGMGAALALVGFRVTGGDETNNMGWVAEGHFARSIRLQFERKCVSCCHWE